MIESSLHMDHSYLRFFEISTTSNCSKNREALTQFITLYSSKQKEFADLITEEMTKAGHQFVYPLADSKTIILNALKDPHAQYPFIRFLSKNY